MFRSSLLLAGPARSTPGFRAAGSFSPPCRAGRVPCPLLLAALLLLAAGCGREGTRPFYPIDSGATGPDRASADVPAQDAAGAETLPPDAPPDAALPGDLLADTLPDAGLPDTEPDLAAQDLPADTAHDQAPGDLGADVSTGDLLPGDAADALLDSLPDSSADVAVDAAQPPDAAPDAAPDATVPDATDDAGSADASGDVAEPGLWLSIGPSSETPFAPGPGNSSGVALNPSGALVVTPPTGSAKGLLWIPRSTAGQVSLLDLASGKEVRRHASCKGPSRSAADADGSLWICCGSSLYKYAPEIPLCKDKNGNGVIDTTEDKNKNGKIDAAEVVTKAGDDCILLSVEMPNYECTGLMVDGQGYAWIARQNTKDPASASVVERRTPAGQLSWPAVEIPFPVVGIASDSNAAVWTAMSAPHVVPARIDPATGLYEVFADGPVSFSGTADIVVDAFDQVLVSSPLVSGLLQLDAAGGTPATIPLDAPVIGLAASRDGYVVATRPALKEVAVTETLTHAWLAVDAAPATPRGVALLPEKRIAAFSPANASMAYVDYESFSVISQVALADPPDTLGDISGYRTLAGVFPFGWYRHVFSTAPAAAVHWTLVAPDVVATFGPGPLPSCYAAVRIRAADTLPALAEKPFRFLHHAWVDATPLDISLLEGGIVSKFLEVEVRLVGGDGGCLPTLQGLSAGYDAP